MPTIRGHQGTFKVYQDSVEKVFDTITRVSVNQDANFIKSFYVGSRYPEIDVSQEGWSGQFEMEVKNDNIDLFIDALITNNLNGIGISDYSFVCTEKYDDGTIASYVYFNCAFKMSKDQSGLNEKIVKRIEFVAAGRQRL